MGRDDVAQKFYRRLIGCALSSHIWRKDRVPEVLTHADMLLMGIEFQGVNKNVILIGHHELVEILMEDIIHLVLEYGKGVG